MTQLQTYEVIESKCQKETMQMTLAQIAACNPLQVSASGLTTHGTIRSAFSPLNLLRIQPNTCVSPFPHTTYRAPRKCAPVHASAAPEESNSGTSTSPEVIKKKTVRRVPESIPSSAGSEAEAVRKVEEGGVAMEGVARVDKGAADLFPIL